MNVHLNWNKKIFSSRYVIYEKGSQVGTLKSNSFSQKVYGELYRKSYTFRVKGFLKQEAEIIEDDSQRVVGLITFSSFRAKANLQFEGNNVLWKYDNLWSTKWSLTDETGLIIKYDSSFTGGQIESNLKGSLLLLAGLFITNYYYAQVTVIMLCVVAILLIR
jgi:hypothetical protein